MFCSVGCGKRGYRIVDLSYCLINVFALVTMKPQLLCFFCVLYFLPIHSALGQKSNFSRPLHLGIPYIDITNDRCDTLTPLMQGAFLPPRTTLSEAQQSSQFVPLKTLRVTSYGSNSCWIRFAIHNLGNKRVAKWMVFAQPGIEYFRLYQLFQGTVDSCEGGLGRDRQKSCSSSYLNSVKLDLAPGDTLICYLFLSERINYYKTKMVHVFDDKAFYQFHSKLDQQLDREKLSLAITCSLIFFIACFFALQSLLGWNTTFLPYSLYLIALTLFFLRHLEALLDSPILFGHFHWVLIWSPIAWTSLIGVTYLKFVLDFFKLGDSHPVHARMFTIFIWIKIIEIVVGIILEVFFFDENYCKKLFGNSQVFSAMFNFYGILVLLKIRGLPFRLVAIGSIVLATSTGITTFIPFDMKRALLGHPMLLVQIGAIIEVLLFSAAFGLKMRQIEKDRRTNEQIRENISSDLHDEIGSTLSSIAILSEALQRKTEQGDNHQSIGVITERTRQVMDTMSDIVWSINPMNDEMAIVLLKMREFAAETLEAKEMMLHFHTDDVLPALRLSIEQRKDFYLFFKEAINNAAKYAQASQIWIKIYKFNQGIQLEIQDNGKGFDATQTIPGNGLQNMRERTQRMRGRMELDTLPGMGTRIKLFIPLE